MKETALRCPACGAELRKLGEDEHAARICTGCRGALVPLRTLTKLLQGPHVQKIAAVTPENSPQGRRTCPGCRRWMLVASFLNRVGSYELDICRSCDVVWFDPGEIEAAPTTPEVIDQTARVQARYRKYWDFLDEVGDLDDPDDLGMAIFDELLWGGRGHRARGRSFSSSERATAAGGASLLILFIELALTSYPERKRKSPLE